MTRCGLEGVVSGPTTSVTPGRTRGPALYLPHEPCPTKAQYGSHRSQDEPVEHVRTADGLAEAIPEDGERDAAWRQTDCRPDREMSKLDPGCSQEHIDHGEGSHRKKADGGNGKHTAARQPVAEPRET